jgi:inner membrane protein
MDLITQGLLGAATAGAGARAKDEVRRGAAVGALAGVLPDADALIQSTTDPLLVLELHRHFTHALLFVPVIALLAALLAWPVLRGRMPFRRILRYALLGAAFAGVLDACTSYGTRLLWPLSDDAVALAIVAIVDPVITLALAVGLVLALRRRAAAPARVALLVAVAYLGLGALQHERAEAQAVALAAQRGHVPDRLLVKPTLANLLLWRSVYLSDGRLHADGIRVGLGSTRIYAGESAPLVRVGDGAMAGQLARFARVSDGLLVRHPHQEDLVGDARFAMLPTGLRPLWGIAPSTTGTGAPLRVVTDRSMSEEERARFLGMLLGR